MRRLDFPINDISRREACAMGLFVALTPMVKTLRPLSVFAATHNVENRAGDQGDGVYLNPIVGGNHPDAGAIRVCNDFYITHTSFSYTPGLIIMTSQDLVNWRSVGSALNRFYGEIWAPYLCECAGHYYIYFPNNGYLQVVHAPSPVGPWSDPISLNIKGIDPAHIATPDGRRFLYMAGGSIAELAADGLSLITAPRRIFLPWPIPADWRVQCQCLEAPKVTFRNDYYYLTVAEGGTAGPPTSHMVISARSRNVDGPWEYSPYNPIIHTKSKEEKWWSTGHGRLIDDTKDGWWMTFHGYENGYRTLGRSTLLLPVEWTADKWFRIPKGVSAGQQLAHSTPGWG
jgi:xylan 1,4-beta-xylosidase